VRQRTSPSCLVRPDRPARLAAGFRLVSPRAEGVPASHPHRLHHPAVCRLEFPHAHAPALACRDLRLQWVDHRYQLLGHLLVMLHPLGRRFRHVLQCPLLHRSTVRRCSGAC
jgi:hypothetical protein